MDVIGSQIDWDYLEEISGGDSEFEQDLVKTFIDSAPGLLTAYSCALASDDSNAARHAVHTLKGSSRSIGALLFADVCENAEKAARAEDLETCRLFQPQIAAAFEALKSDAVEFLQKAA
jgi:HPt (histidine-containing phosphotransfer) domain-containing protein